MVQFLMNCSANEIPATISDQEYQKFKAMYSDTAFMCRSIECAHSIDGFRTETERDNHESSKHVTVLRCDDSTCDYYVSGFTSRRSLVKHNKRYHPLAIAELPTFGIPVSTPEEEDVEGESPGPASNVKYTPVRKRVSKAKRGLPVHVCQICEPPTVFPPINSFVTHSNLLKRLTQELNT